MEEISKKKERIHIVNNRRATFEYHFIQKYEAGVQLTGTEIKSVRQGKVSLSDAYCFFNEAGDLWIKNMHITEYKEGSYNNHVPKRDRKLLLRKTEMRKLQSKTSQKGTTIVPVEMYINERGYAKIEIALASGKKYFDKREAIKEREAKRELGAVRKKAFRKK